MFVKHRKWWLLLHVGWSPVSLIHMEMQPCKLLIFTFLNLSAVSKTNWTLPDTSFTFCFKVIAFFWFLAYCGLFLCYLWYSWLLYVLYYICRNFPSCILKSLIFYFLTVSSISMASTITSGNMSLKSTFLVSIYFLNSILHISNCPPGCPTQTLCWLSYTQCL